MRDIEINLRQHYVADGRLPIDEIYQELDGNFLRHDWTKHKILVNFATTQEGVRLHVPIYTYTSPLWDSRQPTDSVWVMGGVHGEEPAGPIAIAKSAAKLVEIAKNGTSFVVGALHNPSGYTLDWRYFNRYRSDAPPGLSVTDSEHILPKLDNPIEMRTKQASNPYAKSILDWYLEIKKTYKPWLVFDLHEDSYMVSNPNDPCPDTSYCYVGGDKKRIWRICQNITDTFITAGFPMQKDGRVAQGSDGFDVENGFVWNCSDGSFDEKLALEAVAAFVIETPRKPDISLERRVGAHMNIIANIPDYCEMVMPRV